MVYPNDSHLPRRHLNVKRIVGHINHDTLSGVQGGGGQITENGGILWSQCDGERLQLRGINLVWLAVRIHAAGPVCVRVCVCMCVCVSHE